MSMTSEKVVFRLIECPKCRHLMCWLNPRLPSYCPECARPIVALLRQDPSKIHVADHGAFLRYNADAVDTEESIRLVFRAFLHSDPVAGSIALQLQTRNKHVDMPSMRAIVSRAIDCGLREENAGA